MTTESVRFRKYARRMRELRIHNYPDQPSLEVFSVMQLWTTNEPLLPNLDSLHLWGIQRLFIPFIPFLLSPRITSIFLTFESDLPKTTIASTLTALPTLCPNLQTIKLDPLPRDPMITAAVSRMLLVANRKTLQEFYVDSPSTEEASEVLYKLPNLRSLSVVIDGETLLPSASLPQWRHDKGSPVPGPPLPDTLFPLYTLPGG